MQRGGADSVETGWEGTQNLRNLGFFDVTLSHYKCVS